MDYEQTLRYLFEQLPMYQRQGKIAYKKDLTNTIRLLEALGNPHLHLKFVHIAGTNGKGTSAHGIAAALQVAGYRTGLYTSPHLRSFTERIRVNGVEVPEHFVVEFVENIREVIQQIKPSFFEITVVMAFAFFHQEKVDIAVIETGLGGRLDSTNVITPEVSLITSIGFDHMDMLGDTLEKIAYEKAGIIKQQVPVVINEGNDQTLPVFREIANKMNAPLVIAKKVTWRPGGLVPEYLIRNLPGICSTIEVLKNADWSVSEDHVRMGVEKVNELTGLKGRLQVINHEPLVLADVSHNAEGLHVLFKQIREINKGELHVVFGTVRDKHLGRIFPEIPKEANLYWTQSTVPRSMPVRDLQQIAAGKGIQGDSFSDVNTAIEAALQKMRPSDTLLVTGSTFVVAEIDKL